MDLYLSLSIHAYIFLDFVYFTSDLNSFWDLKRALKGPLVYFDHFVFAVIIKATLRSQDFLKKVRSAVSWRLHSDVMTHALGWGTPYNGLYGEAPREKKVPLTDLKYMKGGEIPLVKVHACRLKGWEICHFG